MVKAIRIHKTGGPEVLQLEDITLPAPGPGELLVRNRAIGLNFIDTYFRTGLYPAPHLPFVPGNEAAGEVVSVGPGVTEFKPGDRVAYVATLGSYAEERIAAVNSTVALPEAVSFEAAASMMLKGMTAEYLLPRTYKVKPGDTPTAAPVVAAVRGVRRWHVQHVTKGTHDRKVCVQFALRCAALTDSACGGVWFVHVRVFLQSRVFTLELQSRF